MTVKNQAADPAAPAEDGAPPSGGRATAAEVSSSCTDCATSCTDCATACESGTADEAIAGATACMAACEKNIQILQSFLGMGDKPAEPAPEPVPEDVPAAMAVILSETAKSDPHEAVAEVKLWKASHLALEADKAKLASAHAVLEAKERRGLVASLVKLGVELPATAWADQAGTVPVKRLADEPIDELRARVAKLQAAKPAASDPKPAKAAEPEGKVPDRVLEQFKAKGLSGQALERACADYLRNDAAIRARNTGRSPAKGN